MNIDPSTTRRRYLALWFPFLPADRLERTGWRPSGVPADAPLVLVSPVKGALRLAAVSGQALKLGMTPGLTLADARARLPSLAVADYDPPADEKLVALLAEDSDRWTPLVALDPPHGLILDISGCANLFGGEAALRRRILARFKQAGLTIRATIAGTPETARALARFGNVEVVAPGGEAGAVRNLPVAALEAPEDVLSGLRRAGLKRVQDLADRPSAPLAARFGENLTIQLRRMLGQEDRRITPLRPLSNCLVEEPFAEPVSQSDGIERSLQRLVGRAAKMLEQRGEGGRVFEASFFRTDGVVRRIVVETGRPLRDQAAVLRLFREKLDSLTDPLEAGFGFDLIRLGIRFTQLLNGLQPDLDGRAVEDDEVADLIDRLVARFGRARVLRFTPVDTHDPVRAVTLAPTTDTDLRQTAWAKPEAGEPPLRPLRLFDTPQPIEALAEVPDGPPLRFRWRRVLHDVARAEGPERIASEWWRDQDCPTRDYYRVEDGAGRRFWLFRAGLYGREPDCPRWYLHGIFA